MRITKAGAYIYHRREVHEIRKIPCPSCDAKAGKRCRDQFGALRWYVHSLRVKRWVKTRGVPSGDG